MLCKLRWQNLSTFVLLVVGLATVLYFQRGTPPLVAVASRSMEPVFTLGDLILVSETVPATIQAGDIIVFSVPQPIQERYNYPPSVVHRVLQVDTSGGGLAFRTRGDNAGEDPFTVLPSDVRGQVRYAVPYLGWPILFLQSRQGLVFIVAVLIIYLLYRVSDQLGRSGQHVRRAVAGALTAEVVGHLHELERRQEQTLLLVNQTLDQFAGAMAEYARHLESHTMAVKGLAFSAHELHAAVAAQNEVVEQLRETVARLAQANMPAGRPDDLVLTG